MGNLTDHFASGSGGGSNILEHIEYYADGRTVTTLKGDVTVQNVTSYLNLTTAWVDYPGSVIEYTPPDDTKYVHYSINWKGMHGDANNIIHLQAYLDNSSGTPTAIAQSRATYYQRSSYDIVYNLKTSVSLGNASEDIAAGQLATWDSARTLKWMIREYSSSYEYVVNRQYHWNGTGIYFDNAQPIMTIIATK
jgi:hypothetical protein